MEGYATVTIVSAYRSHNVQPAPIRTAKPRPITEPCELDEFRENVEDFVNNLREVLAKLSRMMEREPN
jgi:hypothetical protein